MTPRKVTGTKTCSRCKLWHQRLLNVWDNSENKDTLICLSCIAELVEGRMKKFVPVEAMKEMLEELG